MRRTILSLSVLFVLAFATGTVLAQGKDEGKGQGGRPADRAANLNKPAEAAKVDVNAPAADKKKAMTSQDIEKQTKEKMKGLTERGQEQGRTQGKSVKDQVAEKMAETRGKAHEQQMRAFEKQAQHDAAKHMERQARLARIRELAAQKGDDKMVARVDELIAKENQLHERRFQRMQAQKRAGGTLPPTEVPLPSMGGKGKVDVEKPAGNTVLPPATKPEVPTPPPAAEKPPEPKP
jgi:hypothetical protein